MTSALERVVKMRGNQLCDTVALVERLVIMRELVRKI